MNSSMMTNVLIFTLCLYAVYAESVDTIVSVGEPDYKILYEEGFYDKALQLLDSLVAADTFFSETVHYYRAACFIAKGDTAEGARAFETILDHHCDYSLDTLFTPPKILRVFHEVRTGFSCEEEKSMVYDTIRAIIVDTVSESSIPEKAAADSLMLPVAFVDTMPTETAFPVRVSLGVLPAGAGQWYQGKKIRGALILSTQIAAVAGCIWSYNKRESYYSKRYGWYEGNRSAYVKYTSYARFGGTIFLGSYIYGIIDYFLID